MPFYNDLAIVFESFENNSDVPLFFVK